MNSDRFKERNEQSGAVAFTGLSLYSIFILAGQTNKTKQIAFYQSENSFPWKMKRTKRPRFFETWAKRSSSDFKETAYEEALGKHLIVFKLILRESHFFALPLTVRTGAVRLT